MLTVSLAAAHSIHISYCKANATATCFSGKVTYYKDDFFMALRNWKSGNIAGLSNDDWTNAKKQFLQSQLRATDDNSTALVLSITASGEDESSIWFEFQFTSSAPLHTLTVTETMLFKEYMDQTNIMMIHTDAKDLNHVFTPSDNTYSITF